MGLMATSVAGVPGLGGPVPGLWGSRVARAQHRVPGVFATLGAALLLNTLACIVAQLPPRSSRCSARHRPGRRSRWSRSPCVRQLSPAEALGAWAGASSPFSARTRDASRRQGCHGRFGPLGTVVFHRRTDALRGRASGERQGSFLGKAVAGGGRGLRRPRRRPTSSPPVKARDGSGDLLPTAGSAAHRHAPLLARRPALHRLEARVALGEARPPRRTIASISPVRFGARTSAVDGFGYAPEDAAHGPRRSSSTPTSTDSRCSRRAQIDAFEIPEPRTAARRGLPRR